jgi:hypothetical protein
VSEKSLRDSILITLQEATPGLRQLQDDCFIIGAAALVLAGINLNSTPDVDLLTSDADAIHLTNFWTERRIDYKPAQPELFRSTYGRFKFSELDVEVMGNLEINQSGVWVGLEINDYFTLSEATQWKIPTLTEQLRILQIFNRPKDIERIALIRQVLDNPAPIKP